METISDKLNKLKQTKNNIKTAIENKGIIISNTDTFSSYANKIEEIQQKKDITLPLDPYEVYSTLRPKDWIELPEAQENEIYLLFHVPNGASSLISFKVNCTDTYHVDIIDANANSTINIISGEIFEKEIYSKDCTNLTNDNMKQCIIKISGNNIKTFETSTHSKKTSPSNFTDWNIVEIKCKCSSATNIICGNTTATKALRKLKFFSWKGLNMSSNMTDMFNNCTNLIAVLDLNNSLVTNYTGMYKNCASLISIPRIIYPSGSNVIMKEMFYGCSSLIKIPAFSFNNVVDTSSMFAGCKALNSIELEGTDYIQNATSMFNGCSSLISIPSLNLRSATTIGSMFSGCTGLMSIFYLNISSSTSMGSLFYNCLSLNFLLFDSEISNWEGGAISLQNCSLGHQALVDLFNSLPDLSITSPTPKVLTITGNPGILELTDNEKNIAINKNWRLKM